MNMQVLADSDAVAEQAAKVIAAEAPTAVAGRGRFVTHYSFRTQPLAGEASESTERAWHKNWHKACQNWRARWDSNPGPSA